MKTKRLSVLLLTFALFNAVSAQTGNAAVAQTPARAASARTLDKAKLDQLFDRLAEKNKAMGSIALAKDGKILYTRAVGSSQINGSEKKPATTASRYRVASLSKIFTSTMTLQLVEEGKLKLSDTLDKFFPEIPNAGKITIEHILGHRSGIHDFIKEPNFRDWSLTPRTREETLAFIAKGKPDFEPGEKRSYSNAGYVVLGHIVEKAGGKPYQEALKKRITGKLGLKDTYLGTGKTNVSKKESFSYRYEGDWKQQDDIDLSIPGGAGAIVSTPSDLVKFLQALVDGKLVSKEHFELIVKNGMGLSSVKLGDIPVYGVTGSMDGFRSALMYIPEEKLALAYTSNGANYSLQNILRGAIDIYQNKPFEIPSFESVAVSAEILDKYAGTYSSPGAPLKVTISREGTTLQAHPAGESAFALEATATDKFKSETRRLTLEFDAAKNQMTLKRAGKETVFIKEK